MRYFFDTEFIEDGKTIDLLSIGIVSEDGREYYAESNEADLSKADDWVKENVIAHLWSRQADKTPFNRWTRDGGKGGLCSRREIRSDIITFCGDSPEFYAYYADYDWVVFCQLFGRMIDLPQGFPMYCRDLKQTLDDYCGMNSITLEDLKSREYYPKQENEHNALDDARWNRDLYQMLTED